MIKNLIFDIGNVIQYFNWEDYLNEFTKSEEEKEFIRKYIFNTPEWSGDALMCLGYITKEDAISNQMDRSNHLNDELLKRFWDNCLNAYTINEDVIDLMKNLKEKGYKLYLLSNYSKNDYDYFKDNDLFKIIDGSVLSYQVHKLKPYDEIYFELNKQYNIKFEESIFFDNVQKNCDTGNKLGLKSIKVNDNDYQDLLNKVNECIKEDK